MQCLIALAAFQKTTDHKCVCVCVSISGVSVLLICVHEYVNITLSRL